MQNNKPIQPKEREIFIPLTFYHFHKDWNPKKADSHPLWFCTCFEQVKDNGGLVYVSQN